MKKTLFIGIFILLCFLAYPQTRAQLDRVFEFDYDLEAVCNALPDQLSTLKNKFFIISASTDAIEIINKEPDSFEAKVTVMYGKWDGSSNLKTYKADIYFKGSDFAKIIPVRPPRDITPDLIVVNRNLTILCQLTGFTEREGLMIPVFDAYKVKMQ